MVGIGAAKIECDRGTYAANNSPKLAPSTKLIKRNWQLLAALALFLAVLGFTALQWDVSNLVHVSLSGLILSLVTALFMMSTQGMVLRNALRNTTGTLLSWTDALLLPFAMHLWTFIIPIKGGFLYSSLFVSRKYGTTFSEGYSSGLAMLLGSLFVNGLFGFLIFVFSPSPPSLFGLSFGLFLAIPLGGLGLASLIARIEYHGNSDVVRFLLRISADIAALASNLKALGSISMLSTVNMAIHCLWFALGAKALGISVDLATVVMITLVLRVLFLVRVLPGNLGIQEVLTAAAFAAGGVGMAQGMAIALLMRIEAVALTLAIGVPVMSANAHHMRVNSLKELFSELLRG